MKGRKIWHDILAAVIAAAAAALAAALAQPTAPVSEAGAAVAAGARLVAARYGW